jgi:hypothetical protein
MFLPGSQLLLNKTTKAWWTGSMPEQQLHFALKIDYLDLACREIFSIYARYLSATIAQNQNESMGQWYKYTGHDAPSWWSTAQCSFRTCGVFANGDM